MNVLSLFDGMSCGQIALERAGIKVDNYFASEIKKYAIECTQRNYPNTIQLGDVREIKAGNLPKIDLLIGGSPCQDFSSTNKEKKGLEGEKSSLFFEYLRLKKELNPKYFLLENVAMDDYSYEFISKQVGVYPVGYNSNLVSAQNRNRLYWFNFGVINYDLFQFAHNNTPAPNNKNILYKDILEYGFVDKLKANCLLETGGGFGYKNKKLMYRRYINHCFTNIVFDNIGCIFNDNIRNLTTKELERLQTVPQGYCDNLTYRQAVSLLGDGWTIDIIAHIFNYLKAGL